MITFIGDKKMIYLRDLRTDSTVYQDAMADIANDSELLKAYEDGKDIMIGEYQTPEIV